MDRVDTDIESLLTAVYHRYGYDFREYSRAHVKRRLLQRLQLSRFESLGELQHKVLSDPACAAELLKDLSINVTEMFRDPDFYRAVREIVVPLLQTWSYLKVWHAGCSTGEEVYSMAIVLREEGLYDRVQIYATDFSEAALKRAREGIYPADSIKKYAQNYQKSGARASFSDYFHARYDSAIMDSSLRKNIVWANHNLVTDGDFAETQMIVCRNVLIYFNAQLQHRVHELFHGSLSNGGILCLGKKETLQFSSYRNCFAILDKTTRIYKKKYRHV